MRHDGNGWVQCRCGRSHWGRFGAAGLLLLNQDRLLLQLRADWVHQGGTWSTPGGARDSHETIEAAALREAHEENGIDPGDLRVVDIFASLDHVDWAYHYVVARPLHPDSLRLGLTPESEAVSWVRLDEPIDLPLHPGFAASWTQTRLRLLSLVRPEQTPG